MDAVADITVSNIIIHASVRVRRGERLLKLDKFKIVNIGHVDLDFEGNNFGFLNSLISWIAGLFMNGLKQTISGALEDWATEMLEPALENIPTSFIDALEQSFPLHNNTAMLSLL